MSTDQKAEKALNEEAPPDPTEGIRRAIGRFVSKLEGIKTSEEIVMPLLTRHGKKVGEEFDSFSKENSIEKNEEGDQISYSLNLKSYARFEELQKRRSATSSACFQTPRALFVALVSTYDAYLGDLLRSLFYLKPELLNASNRTFTFAELVNLADLQAAREYLIEKEVESVVRESHSKHFTWIENRFDLPLRKGLDSWPVFIEATERRNLFVHTDGKASAQYLDVCASHGADTGDIKSGQTLHIGPEYFERAYECIFEVGVKLGHVLWRKVAPHTLEQADSALNTICFDLLKSEKYRLAANLLEFSLATLKKHHSNLSRRVFAVNLGIAYKMGDFGKSCKNHLDKEDWSDCGDHFKLANAVLTDDLVRAAAIMKSLGKDANGIGRLGYETWPLFRQFRATEEFQSAYEEIYGEKFEIPENTVALEQDEDSEELSEQEIGEEKQEDNKTVDSTRYRA